MVLSDVTIKEQIEKGNIVIDPLDPNDIQPASVDVHLDNKVLVFRNSRRPYIDIREDLEGLMDLETIDDETPFILHPGEFILGSTLENIEIPADLVARLEGKSSLGRIGLLIHSTAGFVDPGFSGYLTLELSNVANLPIKIYPEMKIGQISFYYLNSPSESEYGSDVYGSKYQGQEGPTPSKSHTDFNK